MEIGQERTACKLLAMALIATAPVLSSCGGPSPLGPAGPNLSSAPGAAALNAYYQASHLTNLTAPSSGNTFSMQRSFAPNPIAALFNSVTVNAATQTVLLAENDVSLGATIEVLYYRVNPLVLYGSVSNTGTQCEVDQAYSPLPATITAGQSGPLATSTIYHDAAKVIVDGTKTTTYGVRQTLQRR